MIRSILTLRATDENIPRILDLYRSKRIFQVCQTLTRSTSGEISAAVDGSGRIIVTSLWPDAEAYQEWIDHPVRSTIAPELEDLVLDGEVGVATLYEIDDLVTTA